MSRLTKLVEACKYHDLEMQANSPDGKYLRIEIWKSASDAFNAFPARFFKGIKRAEIFIDGYDLGRKSL